MTLHAVRSTGVVPLLLGLVACASTGVPQPSGGADAAVLPPPVDEPAPGAWLTPPEAAVQAAARVPLTGMEMGTMWTFENAPLDYWEETYGFRPSAEWLAHVRLASLRFGRGCSASFVSPHGLVATNHHCARSCVDRLSTASEDHLVDGFYAPGSADEKTCPGLFLDQLVEIQDVTALVRDAAGAGRSDAEVAAVRDATTAELERACEAEADVRCEVVSLFHGGQYQLYKFHRYEPVKLVFAPEMQAGSFGGAYDNWTYPRYDLDVAFVRAYEPDGATPASTPHYFAWDSDGARDGETVFVTGNPGSTSRQVALSQVLYEREARHPFRLDLYGSRLQVLREVAEGNAEQERALRQRIFRLENAEELYAGQLKGLRDPLLIARKIRWEDELRQAVHTEPALHAAYGDVWEKLATIHAEKAGLYPRLQLHDRDLSVSSSFVRMAGLLSAYARQLARAEADRDGAFRADSLSLTEERLRREVLTADELAVGLLAGRLGLSRKWLPSADPLVRAMRPGERPHDAARRLISSTLVGDPGFRGAIMDGGADAVRASDDPLLALLAELTRQHEEELERWEQLTARESVLNGRLALALFEVFGTDIPPDATFTLRISDGVVKGYPYNGTMAPAATKIFGLYARAAEFDNQMPWTLPAAFAAARDAVDLGAALNFVTTNDTTGGNSGSPVIDRDGRFVGILFDGNIENFPNEFLFGAENGRSVSVHSEGITEALRNVYRTEELLYELLHGAEDRLAVTGDR